jgi:hypothetical protein
LFLPYTDHPDKSGLTELTVNSPVRDGSKEEDEDDDEERRSEDEDDEEGRGGQQKPPKITEEHP